MNKNNELKWKHFQLNFELGFLVDYDSTDSSPMPESSKSIESTVKKNVNQN